jgi:hypothetical protein
MANKAQLTLTFNLIPPIFFVVKFNYNGVQYSEQALTTRYGPGYFTVGATNAETTQNLFNALQADYGGSAAVNFAINSMIITVEANLYGFGGFEYTGDIYNEELEPVLFYNEIAEVQPNPVYQLLSHSFSAASSDQNNKVKVALTTENGTAPELFYVAGESISGVSSPFDINRQSLTTALRNCYGIDSTPAQTQDYNIPMVKKYSIIANVLIEISGATVTIEKTAIGTGVEATPFQYSLDGVNYDSSPIFSGILSGNYTAYMTDGYNGLYTYDFEVPTLDAAKPAPYFDIPRANPLRFVNAAAATYKTFDNTLFNDMIIPNIEKKFFRQPFQLTDTPKTQIKTNYENLSIEVKDCSGVVVDTITPTLKIQNVGLKDMRDCYVKEGGEGYTNILFFQGNIYDPDTEAIIDEYFEGSGRLPSFCQVGMRVQIDSPNLNGIFEVIGIVYDNTALAWACVIEGDYPFDADNGICLSVYNNEIFNIYEFTLTAPFAGQFSLESTATDEYPGYTSKMWKSEPVLFDTFENVINIRYWADDNQAGIDYRSLIVFDLCIPGRLTFANPGGEDETFEDDNGNSQLQKSVYIRNFELETNPIPGWMAEKIVIATGHPHIEVNGVEMVRPERPDITFLKGDNNPFCIIKMTLQEKSNVTVGESVGIVSAAQYALGVSDTEVLGI